MGGKIVRAALVVVFIVLFGSLYSFGREDHFATGDSFLSYCSVAEQDADKLEVVDLTRSLECVGYLRGFIGGVFVQNHEDRRPPYCPTNSTSEQDVRIVLGYLRDHPKETE